MVNYKNGVVFERQVMEYYRRKGFYVLRSAGSHGAVDVVAFNERNTILVQCKQERKKVSYAQDVISLLAVPCGVDCVKEFWVKRKNRGVEVTSWPGEITRDLSFKELKGDADGKKD